MRRLALALVMLSSPITAVPTQAQWWGAGGPGPCYGPCRPWAGARWAEGGPWDGPVVVLRPRPWARRWAFGPVGFGWRPARRWPGGWRRFALQPRPLEARRETVESAPEAAPPPVHRRAPSFALRAVVPARAAPMRVATVRPAPGAEAPAAPAPHRRAPAFAVRAPAPIPAHAAPAPIPAHAVQGAVAVMPAVVMPPVREVPRAVLRSSVLSTAAVLHRMRHPSGAQPAAFHAAPRPRVDGATPAPATLRSDPPPKVEAAPAAAAPAPREPQVAPRDVPAAPLD